MKTLLRLISTTLILMPGLASSAAAQADSQARAVRDYLAGQRLFVSYHDGGPILGTYFFYQVHLCPAGNYISYAKSEKTTVEGSKIRRRWTDQGRWDVIAYGGQLGVQYLSLSGQSSFYPVRIGPDGKIWTSPRISVVREGAAQCP